MRKPSTPSNKPSIPPLPRPMERLAKQIERDEYITNDVSNEDSGFTELALLMPDDKKDRIAREPGCEHLFEDKQPEDIHPTSVITIYREDISSTLDASVSDYEEEDLLNK